MFSDREESIIGLIGDRRVTISELTEEFYNGKIPMDGNNIVAGIVRRINMKCDVNGLGWSIVGEGGGRAGRTLWKAKR